MGGLAVVVVVQEEVFAALAVLADYLLEFLQAYFTLVSERLICQAFVVAVDEPVQSRKQVLLEVVVLPLFFTLHLDDLADPSPINLLHQVVMSQIEIRNTVYLLPLRILSQNLKLIIDDLNLLIARFLDLLLIIRLILAAIEQAASLAGLRNVLVH